MKNKQRWLAILLLLLVLSVSAATLAAGEMLSRRLVSGGGGRTSAGGLVMHSAIGQPVAGSVSNGTINLCSGFWCGAVAPDDPGFLTTYLPVVVKD